MIASCAQVFCHLTHVYTLSQLRKLTSFNYFQSQNESPRVLVRKRDAERLKSHWRMQLGLSRACALLQALPKLWDAYAIKASWMNCVATCEIPFRVGGGWKGWELMLERKVEQDVQGGWDWSRAYALHNHKPQNKVLATVCNEHSLIFSQTNECVFGQILVLACVCNKGSEFRIV